MGAAVTAEPKSKSKAEVSAEPAAPAASGFELEAAYGAPAGMPLFLGIGLQRKLVVGGVDDPLEREAEQVAERVMRMPDAGAGLIGKDQPVAGFGSARIQRKCACGESSTGECEECKREEGLSAIPTIQRRADAGGVSGISAGGNTGSGVTEPRSGSAVAGSAGANAGSDGDWNFAPPIVHEALRSSGSPLDTSVRPLMESRFGRDFSDVRVHTDSIAAKSANAVNALAYTSGRDVVFALGQYSPTTGEGQRLLAHELTHTVQQSGKAGVTLGVGTPKATDTPTARTKMPALQRWTNPVVSLKSDKELLDAALNEHDTAALKQVTDFSSISLTQSLQLIDLLNGEGTVWGRDARAMTLLWSSIGTDFEVVASKDGGGRWKTSLSLVPSLSDGVREAKAIKDQFPKDVEDVVTTILEGNRELVMNEMEALGIPLDPASGASPLNEEQRDRMLDMQAAAMRLARLQKSQELARQVLVGWRSERMDGQPDPAALGPEGTSMPSSSGVNAYVWYPVEFDPYEKPPYLQAPTSSPPFIIVPTATIKPYDEVKDKFDLVSTFIEMTLTQYPELFGVAREKSSKTTTEFGTAASPEAARDMLGRGLRQTIGDIERTQLNLGGKIDLLDLTPVHAKMLGQGVQASNSNILWSNAAPASIARQLVADHDFNRALVAMGMETASQALFLLAPLAGPGAIFMMLAAVGIQGAKTAMSISRFEAMATAAGTAAKPGSEIVGAAGVDQAGKEKNADEAALALTAMLIVGGEAIAKVGVPAPESPLDIAARAEAIRILDTARTEEPGVTAALEEAASKVDGKLEGKSHMFKTEESLTRKLRDRAAGLPTGTIDPEGAVRQVSGKVNDALRYTISTEPGNYLTMKQQAYEILQARGYKFEYDWNAWGDPTTPYRGVNSTWRTPKGQLFEVQFHTPESYSVKSSPEIRAMYEEARAAGTAPERKTELEKLMYEKYGVVVPPPGVEVNKP